jgi:hypothetical protein
MIVRAPESRRRRFIRLTAVGLAVAPLVNVLLCETARADELLSEADPAAKALKYRADATLSPDRKDSAAVCDNCALFTPKGGPTSGTCELFKGKLVAAKGWCSSWEGF